MRERIYASADLPVLFRITPFVQPAESRRRAAARGYEAFETTLVQLARLDRPPESPPVAGVDFVTPTPAAFAEAVAMLQETSAEQRDAYLERLMAVPLTTRACSP